MNNYNNLYKLIDGLNNKIKILETNISNLVDKNKSVKNNNKKNIQIENGIKNNLHMQSKLESYRIQSSNDFNPNKKYIGLMFDSNFNNFESDENKPNKNLLSFIKLSKSNIVINYFIQLELNYTPLTPIICSIALGIRTKSDSKIKIIKGTKHVFVINPSDNVLGNINITNTTIYMCGNGPGFGFDEELCIIADLGSICKVNPKKSLIKLLYFY